MSKASDYWAFFAEDARRIGSPLYARLAMGIRDDEALRALAARRKPGQPAANMILGAVHLLLLRGLDHPLTDYYASVGGTRAADDGDPFALFRELVFAHEREIARLIETRATNTNEVGRSALLHPGFRVAGEVTGRPLSLIEIGPSAGLNMIWDRYGVRYLRGGRPVAAWNADAPLVIDCEARGERLPPLGPLPEIATRTGLELDPVDLDDAADRDWLRALVWPEHVARMRRLEVAIALRREAEIEIVAGDALENLLGAMAAARREAMVCVYHTIAVYQFSAEMRATLEDLLTTASLRRPVLRLGFEMAQDHRYLLTLRHYDGGAIQERVLGEGQPHGAWIAWSA